MAGSSVLRQGADPAGVFPVMLRRTLSCGPSFPPWVPQGAPM